MAPVFWLKQPIYNLSIFESIIAPAHIIQGSSVIYILQFVSLFVDNFFNARLIQIISACCNELLLLMVLLQLFAKIFPVLLSTITHPMGISCS